VAGLVRAGGTAERASTRANASAVHKGCGVQPALKVLVCMCVCVGVGVGPMRQLFTKAVECNPRSRCLCVCVCVCVCVGVGVGPMR